MTEEPELRARRSLDRFLAMISPERFFIAMGVAGIAYAVLLNCYFSLTTSEFQQVGLLGWLPFLIATSMLAALLTVVSSAIAILLALGIHLTLGIPIEHVRGLAFTGGLTGLLSLIPLFIRASYQPTQGDWLWGAQWFLVGPCVVTPLFQYAGGWSAIWDRGTFPPERPSRFGISQLLVATAWAAGLLALLKTLGWLTPWIACWVGLWAVYQWCSLRAVIWLLRRGFARREVLEAGGGDGGGMRG